MKRFMPFLLLLLVSWQSQAQTNDIQQMEHFKAQIDSALQDKNAAKATFIYGQIVALCRVNRSFEHELIENLYYYGMWATS
jgi:hypothetical protein